jgi:hypothetical protein
LRQIAAEERAEIVGHAPTLEARWRIFEERGTVLVRHGQGALNENDGRITSGTIVANRKLPVRDYLWQSRSL